MTTTVCVTGASGYLASHIIQQLQQQGFRVRGTVRSKSDASKTQHLMNLCPDAKYPLELYEADLMKEGSFDEAFKDCDYVIHAASPFFIKKVKNPDQQIVQPALNGTKNVFQSVAKAGTVRRLVLTSSTVSIVGDYDERGPGHVFTEDDWNITSTASNDPYPYSKTVAEKAAWELAKEHEGKFDMAVINPGFIMGPVLSGRSDAASVDFIMNFLSGNLRFGTPTFSTGIVDVRDVARAHILALQNPDAGGKRFICVNKTMWSLDIAESIRKSFPQFTSKLPTWYLPKLVTYTAAPFIGVSWRQLSCNAKLVTFDNARIRNVLGMTEFIPADQTVRDMVQSLLDHQIAVDPAASSKQQQQQQQQQIKQREQQR